MLMGYNDNIARPAYPFNLFWNTDSRECVVKILQNDNNHDTYATDEHSNVFDSTIRGFFHGADEQLLAVLSWFMDSVDKNASRKRVSFCSNNTVMYM